MIAAGNDGTDNDGDGKINLKSVTSPGTANSPVIRRSRGSEAFNVAAGARRISRSHGSSNWR